MTNRRFEKRRRIRFPPTVREFPVVFQEQMAEEAEMASYGAPMMEEA
ncbi:hypothetical protein [Novimethylophilus kurashikiensis]|nr:hypothetical protein [Novimethylophilus kurashikiensis]